MKKNPFHTLGLRQEAFRGMDDEEVEEIIANAYRGLVKIFHPDVRSDDVAVRRFQEVTEAYTAINRKKADNSFDYWYALLSRKRKDIEADAIEAVAKAEDRLELQQRMLQIVWSAYLTRSKAIELCCPDRARSALRKKGINAFAPEPSLLFIENSRLKAAGFDPDPILSGATLSATVDASGVLQFVKTKKINSGHRNGRSNDQCLQEARNGSLICRGVKEDIWSIKDDSRAPMNGSVVIGCIEPGLVEEMYEARDSSAIGIATEFQEEQQVRGGGIDMEDFAPYLSLLSPHIHDDSTLIAMKIEDGQPYFFVLGRIHRIDHMSDIAASTDRFCQQLMNGPEGQIATTDIVYPELDEKPGKETRVRLGDDGKMTVMVGGNQQDLFSDRWFAERHNRPLKELRKWLRRNIVPVALKVVSKNGKPANMHRLADLEQTLGKVLNSDGELEVEIEGETKTVVSRERFMEHYIKEPMSVADFMRMINESEGVHYPESSHSSIGYLLEKLLDAYSEWKRKNEIR